MRNGKLVHSVITTGGSLKCAPPKSKCSFGRSKIKDSGCVFLIIIIIILLAKSLLGRHLIKGDRPNTADSGLGVMTDLSEGLCTKWLPIK